MNETLTTANDTADILAGMFTENTGRHMLDSGGAYGRNWEHNQGRTTADFLNALWARSTSTTGRPCRPSTS